MFRALKCVSALFLVFAIPPAFSQTRYTVHDLESIGGLTTVYAVSPQGFAVGDSYTFPGSNFFHVFINRGNGIQDLGTMGGYGANAYGINSSEQIVGASAPTGGGHFRAFQYQNGNWTDLGVGGGYRSYASGINAAGDVVGAWLATNGSWTGFLYRNGVMTDLPTLGGTSGEARAINDSGHITGWARTASGATRAYKYVNGVMTDLGTLGGLTSTAYDINNSGDIVGQSITTSGNNRAFLFTGGVMHNIDNFGGRGSRAQGINNLGQSVGWYSPTGGNRAFIAYGFTTTYDLNSLIPANSGWVLTDALDINDVGEIVGRGTLNGATRAFILRPVETVTVSPDSVSVGDFYNVFWTAPNGRSSTDWIGMYRTGDPDSAYLWYGYTGGATSGSFFLEATSAGTFEFRYFANNTFQRKAVSSQLTVNAPAGITVTASPTVVNPGANVRVDFTAPSGRPTYDWIGLYRLGADNREYLWWTYANGATSGSFNLSAPMEAGEYEFRYLANNGWIDLARSNSFRVNAANYTLQAAPTAVSPGGTVTVTWSAPDGSSSGDWIAVFREGEPENRNYLWEHWFYTGGTATGSRDITMPTSPGRYVLRYLLDNGYTHVAESAVVTVQ